MSLAMNDSCSRAQEDLANDDIIEKCLEAKGGQRQLIMNNCQTSRRWKHNGLFRLNRVLTDQVRRVARAEPR